MSPQIQAFFDPVTATVTYVVHEPAPGGACAIIDSVLDYDPKSGRSSTASADRVADYVRQHDLKTEWLLETHAHADHLSAAPYLQRQLGGVIANQDNAARLLADENLVGIFPEGIRGIFSRYSDAYRLRDFAKSAFAKIAIQNHAPIIPVAVVGHAEIFPILGGFKWTYITKTHGWPYFPIAPPFPLAPVPIPSKRHIRVLEPVPADSLRPGDAENRKLMRDFSRYIQSIVQTNIDDMLPKRKNWFWGRILNGAAPAREPFKRP